MQKSPHPYLPFQDAVLGEVLFKTVQAHEAAFSFDNLKNFHLFSQKPEFAFTPNAKKQVLHIELLSELRSCLEKEDVASIYKTFEKLLEIDSNGVSKFDIALELLEWMYTGFGETKLFRELLLKIFSLPQELEQNLEFWKDFEKNFQTTLQEGLNNNSSQKT